MSRPAPLILDFDGSVLPIQPDERRLDLRAWEEEIRYACPWSGFKRLEKHLAQTMPTQPGCVFLGSGDFHHVSLALLKHTLAQTHVPLDLIICDNHPDNMRYPFGLHCGSWVTHAARLEAIRHVHVLGITSPDICWAQAWQNRLTPLIKNKLTYWSLGQPAGWLGLLGLGDRHKNFAHSAELIQAFSHTRDGQVPVYLSVDKDVLSTEIIQTNWDQGRFSRQDLRAIIDLFPGRLTGADLCGDVSAYDYKSRFKRLLTRLDGQKSPSQHDLRAWQQAQQALNIELAERLGKALESAGI